MREVLDEEWAMWPRGTLNLEPHRPRFSKSIYYYK